MVNNNEQYKIIRNMHGDSLFIKYFNRLNGIDGNVIEVGSTRDAGSTYKIALRCKENNNHFITIDPCENSNKDAKNVINKIDKGFEAILSKGEVYLKSYHKKPIIGAYLDGFDIVTGHPHKQSTINFYKSIGIDLLKDGNRISAEVHLQATKYILKNNGETLLIGFDDTWCENKTWKGKGATAIPHLIENQFTVLESSPNGVVLIN